MAQRSAPAAVSAAPPPALPAFVKDSGSALVLGLAGSGKTTLLLARAAHLVGQGVPPGQVALTTFAFRSIDYLRAETSRLHPHLLPGLNLGTLRDYAAAQLTAGGQAFTFVSNNQTRQLMRQAMALQGFAGTLTEAENLIRSAKSRAKKLPESSPAYPFLQAYQQALEQLGTPEAPAYDRHDLIRQHLKGLKNGTLTTLPVKAILLDNLQDATELQLIWLQAHLNAGVELWLTADDDTTAYAPAGALGPLAVQQVMEWPNLTTHQLPGSHRLALPLGPALVKFARQLRTRQAKPEACYGAPLQVPPLTVHTQPTAPAAHAHLLTLLPQLVATHGSVGILTRTQGAAQVLTHILHRAQVQGQLRVPAASFARKVWEDPTPQLVLAMLHLMVNQGTTAHLVMMLLGFSVPPSAVQHLTAHGLDGTRWLAQGCLLPPLPEDASPTTRQALQRCQQAWRTAGQVLAQPTPPGSAPLSPRDVFKALVADLLPHLPPPEHPAALLATEMLLTLSGKLTEVLPTLLQETLPSLAAPITVAPVPEVRNRQFGAVILPYAQEWETPTSTGTSVAQSAEAADHTRRLLLLACTRTPGPLHIILHGPNPTLPPLLDELQTTLKRAG